MSSAPRPGMIRFHGASVSVYFMAICQECDMAIPFDHPTSRFTWYSQHKAATKHTIEYAVDVRPNANEVPVTGTTIVFPEKRTIAELRQHYSYAAPYAVTGYCPECRWRILRGDRAVEACQECDIRSFDVTEPNEHTGSVYHEYCLPDEYFDTHGKVDYERLRDMGFQHIGTLNDEDSIKLNDQEEK